jgi:hypothetical protein
MINFDNIVKKVLKKWWKVLWKEDIYEIIDPERKPEFQKKVDMVIYRMKAQKVILSIKSGVYIVPTEEDKLLNQVDLMEKYYLWLVKKYIRYYVWNQYFLSGKKSLEIHMKDFSIPEKLVIITRNLDKKIKVWNYEIIFKTISGKSEWRKINLFSKLYPMYIMKNIEWIDLKIAWLEHALLETALMQENYEWVSLTLLVKAIKKYGTILDYETLSEIWKYKYIMSFNRIKEISKPLDSKLSQLCLDVIKQNWGLFIWEWLRGI